MNEVYEALAKRNGWTLSMIDGRPYFMKDSKYAVPDETTSYEDKLLLASIISEGSDELAKLILLCWENEFILAGPCSGIREFHNEPPFALHFGCIKDKETISAFYSELKTKLPSLSFLYRDLDDGTYRLDVDLALRNNNIELSKEEAERVFATISKVLSDLLERKRLGTY